MIDLITGQCAACVCAEKPIDRTIIITELREIGLHRAHVRVRLLSGVALIDRLSVRVVIVGIVIRRVIGIKVPRIKSGIQSYPEAAVPAPPVAVEEMRVTSVPISMPAAILASEDMMLSAKRRFI